MLPRTEKKEGLETGLPERRGCGSWSHSLLLISRGISGENVNFITIGNND